MLSAHMAAHEEQLLATARIPANSGHTLHKGTPREAFIRSFLETHLSERLAIGTGEIIDASSKPGEKRHQIDVVVHKREYPRLDFGGGVSGFLIESVVATISVKSDLTKPDFETEMRTAASLKLLKPSMTGGMQLGTPPVRSPLCFLVAYDGPASMTTVHNWIHGLSETIQYPRLSADASARAQQISPALDGVFVLGRGLIHYGNARIGFFDGAQLKQDPEFRWAIADTERGALLTLFLLLTTAATGMSSQQLNPVPYLSNFTLPGEKLFHGR